jgi:glycosyltransferase involved in cell wall biosynthesis
LLWSISPQSRIPEKVNLPLALGVDAANLLHDRRGIGRYARAVLSRWIAAHRDRVTVTLLVPHLFPAFVRDRLRAEAGGAATVARRSQAAALGLEAVWYPWNGMTWLAPMRRIATVHDVWPFVEPAADERRRRNEQEPFRTTAREAALIVADSAFTKSEIEHRLAPVAAPISVVHLGTAYPPAFAGIAPAVLDGARRYVLFVGEAEERKNVFALITAMGLLPPDVARGTALVLAGRYAPSVRDCALAAGIDARLEGEVSDARLAALYRGAAAFVFPSRYEGFGLPVLEAMAYGTPVIASDAASIPEAGGDAALYFAPTDTAALAALLARVLSDETLADDLRQRGLRRAAIFTWDRCADATLLAIETAVAETIRTLK